MRRIHSVLLGLITLVVGVLAAQPAQALDATVITGGGNFTTPNILQITFVGDTIVKTVKATLKPQRQPGQPPVEISQFTLTRDGTNTTADSAPVDPGYYDTFDIAVEATDTEGNQLATSPDAFFYFSWLVKPTLELTATPSTLDVDHQVTRISGTATATRPMGEPLGVLANRKLTVGLITDPEPQVGKTDAQGRFTASVRAPDKRMRATVRAAINAVQIDEIDLATAVGDTPLTMRPTATRLSAKADKTRVLKGQKITVRGRLERKKGATWTPLAGQTVTVGGTQVKTDASGNYQARRTMLRTERPLARFGLNDVGADTEVWYLGVEAMAGRVVVPVATSFSNVKVTVDAKGKVEASGSFHPGNPAVRNPQVQLEFSPNGTRNWALKKTLNVRSGSFATTFQHRQAGYWRVVYKGDFDHLRGVSRVHKAWRWGTWISTIKASPTRVRVGGTTTVSGRLTRRWNSRQPRPTAFPGQTVRIIFRFKGQGTWYHLGWAKTNRNGGFAGRVVANGDGFYAVVFHGSNDTFAADSPNKVYVDTTR